ncbi:MAG: SRPBCC domain-containing protein [Gammaproteobacteria bacterium]|nr:SRPBCC domain-containing protein [Gammaproteobacteria bacterium]
MSTILVGVKVQASADLAFRLFTENPQAWWLPNDCFEFSSKGPGKLKFLEGTPGQFVEKYADGSFFPIGDILVWEPGRELVFTWRQERFDFGVETVVQVIFTAMGDMTRVSVLHKGWGSIAPELAAARSEIAPIFLPTFTHWWQDSLATFDAVLAGHGQVSQYPTH